MSKISALDPVTVFNGTEQVVMIQAGATLRGAIGGLVAQVAAPHVAAAEGAAATAVAAAATAAINRKVYATTIAGLADTAPGDYFFTPGASAEEFLLLWSHDAGAVATLHGAMPSSDLLAALQAAGAAADDAADAANATIAAGEAAALLAAEKAALADTAATAADESAAAADEARLALQANYHAYTVDAGDEQGAFTLPVAPVIRPVLYVNGVRQAPARVDWEGTSCLLDPPVSGAAEVEFVVVEPVMQPAVMLANVIGLADQLAARPTAAELAEPAAAATIGTANGSTVEAEIQRAFTILNRKRVFSLLEFASTEQLDDMTGGAPEMDHSILFQNFWDTCHAQGFNAHIPGVHMRLSEQIVSRPSVSWTCDSDAQLQWVAPLSAGQWGWTVSGTGLASPGFCDGDVPRLIGPEDISGYYDVPRAYSVAGFTSGGFRLHDCIWSNIRLQYAIGWGRAVGMTNAAIPTDNNAFELGTLDICRAGIAVISPAGALKPVGQSRFVARNIFAYRPVELIVEAGGQAVFQVDVTAVGLGVAEAGGSCVWTEGTSISECVVRGRMRNGYTSTDSPAALPKKHRGAIVSGDQSGWSVGTRNSFLIELDDYVPGKSDDPEDLTPPAVTPIRVRGNGSSVAVVNPRAASGNEFTSIALSSTQGLAHFNGGSPTVHNEVRVSIAVPTLAAGAVSVPFYFYSSILNPDNPMPVAIAIDVDVAFPSTDSDLIFRATNDGANVLHQVKIVARNPTGGEIAAQTVNLWIKVR